MLAQRYRRDQGRRAVDIQVDLDYCGRFGNVLTRRVPPEIRFGLTLDDGNFVRRTCLNFYGQPKVAVSTRCQVP